jgi:phage protein D
MPSNNNLLSEIEVKLSGSKAPTTFMESLMEATIENSLHLPSVATLLLYDADLTWIDDSRVAPGRALQIIMSVNKQMQQVFDGEIVELEPDFDQGVQRLTIRAFDKMHRLARGQQTRSFLNVTDSDIIKRLAGEVGLEAKVDATPEVYPYVFQNNESNLSFLRKRAATLGYLLYVQGRTLYCQAPRGNGATITVEWGKDLNEFHPRLSTIEQVAKMEARGWDPANKQAIVGQATSQVGVGLPSLGSGSADGGSLTHKAFSISPQVLVADRPVRTQGQADQLAQAAANRQAGRFVEAEGLCYGNPKLVAGVSVTITRVGQRFSGSYFVTNTVHTYSAQHGYHTHFSVSGLHPAALLSQLLEKEQAEQMAGLVIGIVTDNNDPEDMGRVKVKYPWLTEEHASYWARVIAPGAGNQRGIEFLPEVNDEVLVGFELGDINYPYVLGGLWNGHDKLPESVVTGGQVQKRIIRSRQGHIITLDDSDSGGGITIQDKNGNKLVLNSAENKLNVSVQGEASLEADGNITVNTKGNMSLKATGDISLEATGQVSIKANAGVTIDGGAGNTEIKGLNVNVKGIMINLN